jgi:hypothetical protein
LPSGACGNVELHEKRLEEIVNATLDHLQLSFQGAEEKSERIFGNTKACSKVTRGQLGGNEIAASRDLIGLQTAENSP